MWRLLLPLLLASACGLDDFSWGGPLAPCDVVWSMTLEDQQEGWKVAPEVARVERDGERVTWLATYAFGGEEAEARFTITGPRLDVRPLRGPPPPAPSLILSSVCTYEEERSRVREKPLARWACAFRFDEDAHVPPEFEDEYEDDDLLPAEVEEEVGPRTGQPPGLLVLEEVDRCHE